MFIRESLLKEQLLDKMQVRHVGLDIGVLIECNNIETIIVGDTVFRIQSDGERTILVDGGPYKQSANVSIDDFVEYILKENPTKITLCHTSGRTDTYTCITC